MNADMHRGIEALVRGVVLSSMGLLGGCKAGSATATERLWVSTIPTSPKTTLTAFVTTRSDDEHQFLGAFFQGTLLRGGHDVFRWQDAGKGRAHLQFLQDGREYDLELEPCSPSRGFDYCLDVYGDPTGTVRYQSRKRWVVRRPGRKRDAAAGLVAQAMLELAEDDAELAEALDAAAQAEGASE
ncbi:MAG: hypothetical protein KDK70_17690 [Myxococcales bacterium]|nr:hypothetical protein [Myxococcales bacterium]